MAQRLASGPGSANTKKKGTVVSAKATPAAYAATAPVFAQAGTSMRQGQTPAQYNANTPPPSAPYTGAGAGSAGGFGAPSSAPAFSAPRMNQDDWLAGDAEFLEQGNEYNRALQLFTDRIRKKKTEFDDDYKMSKDVTGKNQQQSMTGLGEDFAARGMAYSGLFDSARTDTENVFKRQLGNLELTKNRNVAQADDDLADYQQEIDLSRGNAKRNALARFANQQSLM